MGTAWVHRRAGEGTAWVLCGGYTGGQAGPQGPQKGRKGQHGCTVGWASKESEIGWASKESERL